MFTDLRRSQDSRKSIRRQGEPYGVLIVSSPDADYIGGFLDVFGHFEVEVVYAGLKLDWGGVRDDA